MTTTGFECAKCGEDGLLIEAIANDRDNTRVLAVERQVFS